MLHLGVEVSPWVTTFILQLHLDVALELIIFCENCSSIIEDIQDMCRAGLATLAIFYCDFRDKNKQNALNLLSSVLIQLYHRDLENHPCQSNS